MHLSLWQGFYSVDMYLITTNYFLKPCYHIRQLLAIIDVSYFVFQMKYLSVMLQAVDFYPRLGHLLPA